MYILLNAYHVLEECFILKKNIIRNYWGILYDNRLVPWLNSRQIMYIDNIDFDRNIDVEIEYYDNNE